MVKEYIEGRINVNEFEKLKHIVLSEDQLNVFENIDNPPFTLIDFVEKEKIESVWKDVITNKDSMNDKPFEELYSSLKQKETKSDIDQNIINLIDQIIEISK